jgi:hypothetical protein
LSQTRQRHCGGGSGERRCWAVYLGLPRLNLIIPMSRLLYLDDLEIPFLALGFPPDFYLVLILRRRAWGFAG